MKIPGRYIIPYPFENATRRELAAEGSPPTLRVLPASHDHSSCHGGADQGSESADPETAFRQARSVLAAVINKGALAAEFSRRGESILADGKVMRNSEIVGIRREVSAVLLIRYYASRGHARGSIRQARSVLAAVTHDLPAGFFRSVAMGALIQCSGDAGYAAEAKSNRERVARLQRIEAQLALLARIRSAEERKRRLC